MTKTRCRSCRKERPYLLAARTRDCRGNGATRGLPHGVGGAGEVGLHPPRVPADEAHTRVRERGARPQRRPAGAVKTLARRGALLRAPQMLRRSETLH